VVPFLGSPAAAVLGIVSAVNISPMLGLWTGLLFWGRISWRARCSFRNSWDAPPACIRSPCCSSISRGPQLAGVVGALVAIPVLAGVWEVVRALYVEPMRRAEGDPGMIRSVAGLHPLLRGCAGAGPGRRSIGITPALVGWRPRADGVEPAGHRPAPGGAERFFVARVVGRPDGRPISIPGRSAISRPPAHCWRKVHAPEMSRLADGADARLEEPIRDLEGQTMRLWRFLMAMVEHEVHHRSQLDCWLAEAGARPPQLYGYPHGGRGRPGAPGAAGESARMAEAWRTTSFWSGFMGPESPRWGDCSPAASAGASSRPTT
jgi:hypothetical protein